MDFFKEWIFSVCSTLVISVIFSLFTPKGRMQEFYKIVISIFIFVSFLYPFKTFDAAELRIDASESYFEVNKQAKSGYEDAVDSQIKKLLEENNVTGADVTSKVKFDIESGEIEIMSVQIAVSDEYSAEQVKSLVFEKTGINAKVIYIGQ